MTPYYQHAGITIYHGDCREIVPQIQSGGAEAMITDPVWPNCEHVFPGINAFWLLRETLELIQVKGLVIHLGVNSDPRFLCAVPERWPFRRVCYLEFIPVSYIGQILRDADVAYVFGSVRPPKGMRVIPGRCQSVSRKNDGDIKRGWGRNRVNPSIEHLDHPSTRKLDHLRWLVKWFGGGSVIDPFCGSGTTLLAAKSAGISAIGIDIEERYCEIAAKRLSQEVLRFG